MLKIGYSRPLREDDLYNNAPEEGSDELVDRLEKLILIIFNLKILTSNLHKIFREWNLQIKKNGKNASLIKALGKIYFFKYFLLSLLMFLEVKLIKYIYEMKTLNKPLLNLKEAINFFQPFLINNVLKYFEGSIDFKTAIIYGFVLSFLITLKCFLHHPYFLKAVIFGQRARIACSGLIYKYFLQKTLHFLEKLNLFRKISKKNFKTEYI